MIEDVARRQADSIAQLSDAARKRALKLTTARLRSVKAKLDTLELGSWGHASYLATARQLQAAVSQLSQGQTNLLTAHLGTTARVSARELAGSLRALDQAYSGVTRPLRFDTTEWIANNADQISKVRLREYAQSFARYGASTVEAIEDEIAKSVLTGEPWTVARQKVWGITKDVVGDRQWMVDRILRTETSAAYNGTALAAMIHDDDPQDRMMKRLVATFDGKTGRDSIMLHGQTVPVREPFVDPYFGKTYMAPPNRPHDREVVVPWRERWGDAFKGGDRGYVADTAAVGEVDRAPDVLKREGKMADRARKRFDRLQRLATKPQTITGVRQQVVLGQMADLRSQLRVARMPKFGLSATDAALAQERVVSLEKSLALLEQEQAQLTELKAQLDAAAGGARTHLTLDQAASAKNIGRPLLKLAIKKGELPATTTKVGGRTRTMVSPADLEAWLVKREAVKKAAEEAARAAALAAVKAQQLSAKKAAAAAKSKATKAANAAAKKAAEEAARAAAEAAAKAAAEAEQLAAKKAAVASAKKAVKAAEKAAEKAAAKAVKDAEKAVAKAAAARAKLEAKRLAVERARAAVPSRSKAGAGSPLHGRMWGRMKPEMRAKVQAEYDRSLAAIRRKGLDKRRLDAFTEGRLFDDDARRAAARESRALYEELQPAWHADIMAKVSDAWSANSVRGSAALAHHYALRMGFSDIKKVTMRAQRTGKLTIESRRDAYVVDLDTGVVTAGGLRVGNIDDIFAGFYAHTQAMLHSQGVTKLRLYRGVADKLADEAQEALTSSRRAMHHVVESDPVASWAEAPASSARFAQELEAPGGFSGRVFLTREADVTEVVIDRRASPYSIGLTDENECVLAGNSRRVNGVAETQTLGNDHLRMGYGGGGENERDIHAILMDVSDVGDDVLSSQQVFDQFSEAGTPILPGRGKRTDTSSVQLRRKYIGDTEVAGGPAPAARAASTQTAASPAVVGPGKLGWTPPALPPPKSAVLYEGQTSYGASAYEKMVAYFKAKGKAPPSPVYHLKYISPEMVKSMHAITKGGVVPPDVMTALQSKGLVDGDSLSPDGKSILYYFTNVLPLTL